MEITFNFPHVYSPDSSSEEESYVLRASLDYLVSVNRNFLRFHPDTPPLYQAGVRYGRTVIWDSIPRLYQLGYGDCKSLACALIAQYQLQNISAKPTFRWVRRSDGHKDVHILVRTNQGFEDPSKILGMPTSENSPFYDPARYTVSE